MSKKTLGDEIKDENEHQRWLIENGKLYDAAIARAERAEAERDELQRAIMRLPVPPREMGDGPDERVMNMLQQLDAARAELAKASDSAEYHRNTYLGQQTEIDNLRAALTKIASVSGRNGHTATRMIEYARTALDAKETST